MHTPRTSRLPRNVWAVSLTSFFTDISSEMVLNLLPLYLSSVLGVRTNIIGLIEGVAEATASLLKIYSGWLSDRLRGRKWVAVVGYGLSALSKPLFYFASTWGLVAGVRWMDRVGKGVRTAPRDALVADSVEPSARGLAFGVQRAFDTAGAFVGLAVAWWVVRAALATGATLNAATFQRVVLISIVPGLLAVVVLALGARDVALPERPASAPLRWVSLGRPFLVFLLIAGLFDLGNSSDAFLTLRAQERGASVVGILGMLLVFNAVYTAIAGPAGSLSDRIGRRRVIVAGWLLYAAVYLGFALTPGAAPLWALYALYGVYYGMTYGTGKAFIADLVSADLRGTAYGAYNAVLGLLDLPASLIAGILWQGVGQWAGFGAASPFYFGAATALLAAVAFMLWRR